MWRKNFAYDQETRFIFMYIFLVYPHSNLCILYMHQNEFFLLFWRNSSLEYMNVCNLSWDPPFGDYWRKEKQQQQNNVMWEKLNKYFMRHLPWFDLRKETDEKYVRNWRFLCRKPQCWNVSGLNPKKNFTIWLIRLEQKKSLNELDREKFNVDWQPVRLLFLERELVLTCIKTDSRGGRKSILA